MNLNCDISEGFKVSDNKKKTITLSMIVDMNVKIDMIKSVLSNIKLKISRNLNKELTKDLISEDEKDNLDNKLSKLEEHENIFIEKLEEIENIKDEIYTKLSENSINNINELTRLELRSRKINEKLLESSIKEDVNNDLEKLDPYVTYLKNVLLDIIKIGV
jgi:uncharacterized membrane-anchored protein YhcB (DUF1043 family)